MHLLIRPVCTGTNPQPAHIPLFPWLCWLFSYRAFVSREQGKNRVDYLLRGVGFLGQRVHIYCILFDTSCNIFTPFYHTVTGVFVTRLIGYIKAWIDNLPLTSHYSRAATWNSIGLNVSYKLLSLDFNCSPQFFLQLLFSFTWPTYGYVYQLYLSIQEMLTHLSF